jgi:hypothetical protein
MPQIPAQNDLRDAIQALRTLSPRLNKVTDEANQIVRDVEAFLNEECSIGVTAVVNFQYLGHPDDGPCGGLYLEYRRVGGKFRIAIVESDVDGEDVSVKPWADSPRHEKLDSFKVLPELIREIASKVEESISDTEKTTKEIASTLAPLRKSAKAPIPPSAKPPL